MGVLEWLGWADNRDWLQSTNSLALSSLSRSSWAVAARRLRVMLCCLQPG